jgi:hypothetical protein
MPSAWQAKLRYALIFALLQSRRDKNPGPKGSIDLPLIFFLKEILIPYLESDFGNFNLFCIRLDLRKKKFHGYIAPLPAVKCAKHPDSQRQCCNDVGSR